MPAVRGHHRDVHGRVVAGRDGADRDADVRPGRRPWLHRPRPGRHPRPSRTRRRRRGPPSVAGRSRRGAARRACRRSRTRRSRASSRAGRAPPRSRPPRTCRRAPRRTRRAPPGRLPRPRRRASRAAPRRIGPRGDPDVDRLLPRVGRHDRVGGAQQRLAQALGDLRLADPRQPERAHLGLDADPARGQPRQHLVGPHRPHLARRPREGDDHAPVGPGDQPARRRPVGVGQDRRRRDRPRLLAVDLRERLAPPRPELSQPCERRLVLDRRLAAGLGDGLAGEVVRGGAEAAGGDDEVRARERRPEGVDDDGQVVGEVRDPQDGHALRDERSGELAAVGVGRLADGELGADGQELRGDELAVARRRRLKGGCIGHGASVLDG